MLHFSSTRSASGYTNAEFRSIFPTCFFVGVRTICLCANALKLEYWHLFIACKNWLCGYETWMKAVFSWMKNTFSCSQFSPRNTGNSILELCNSKMSRAQLQSRPTPRTPEKRGLTAPCWYSRWLLYSKAWIRLERPSPSLQEYNTRSTQCELYFL